MSDGITRHKTVILGRYHHFVKHLLELLGRYRPLTGGEHIEAIRTGHHVRQHAMHRLHRTTQR